MKRIARIMAASAIMSTVSGVLVLAGPSVANASCSTDTSLVGIYYYKDTSCATLLRHDTGCTTYNDLGNLSPSMYNNLSSVLIARSHGSGQQYYTYLFDAINEFGNSIGLTNVSTTANKSFELTQYGDGGGTWNDVAKSLTECTE